MKNWPKYDTLDHSAKADLIKKHHEQGEYSIKKLAELTETYPNKLRRDAKKFGIRLDSRSESQTKALRTGALSHPTEGKEHPPEVKEKIGMSRRESWQEMTDEERDELSAARKQQYKEMAIPPHLSPNKVINLQKAAKYGSKIELAVLGHLRKHWDCEHQAEDMLGQETYHVDILIRSLNIAIEVDGPAHYKEIWSAEKLQKTKDKDSKKTSLITNSGYTLIRAIADKKFSVSYAKDLADKIKDACDQIINGKISQKVIYVKI